MHRGWSYTEIACDRGLTKTIEDPLRDLRFTRRESESVDKDAPFLVSEYLGASTAGWGRHADGARSRNESARTLIIITSMGSMWSLVPRRSVVTSDSEFARVAIATASGGGTGTRPMAVSIPFCGDDGKVLGQFGDRVRQLGAQVGPFLWRETVQRALEVGSL